MKNTKKLLMLSYLFLILGIVFAAGCVDSGTDTTPPSDDTTVPPIADAALYRGIVADVENDGDQINVTLKRAVGTNFGAEQITFLITNKTNIKFNKSEIQEGRYLEVYYGGTSYESPQTALAVNLLPDADKCNYNGVLDTIVTVTPDQSGALILILDDGETKMSFPYSSSTQFYLTFSELKEGDKLNIYTTGVILETNPAQSDAKEVRPFYSP